MISKNIFKIRVSELRFPEVNIKPSELHKARGYFGREFKEFDLLHNHNLNTNKVIYRYPAIQFKITDKGFSIFTFGDKAIGIFVVEFPHFFTKQVLIIFFGKIYH
jgi:hypothetical protein